MYFSNCWHRERRYLQKKMSKNGNSQISKSDDWDPEECWDCYTDSVAIRSTSSFTYVLKCHLVFSWIVLVVQGFTTSALFIFHTTQLLASCALVFVFVCLWRSWCCAVLGFAKYLTASAAFPHHVHLPFPVVTIKKNKNKKLQICQLFSGGKKAEVPEQKLLVYTDHIFLKILCKCPPSLYLRRYICTIRPTTLVDHSDDHLDRVIAWLPLLQHWTVERTFDFSPEDLMSKVRFPNIQIVESSWKSINHLM